MNGVIITLYRKIKNPKNGEIIESKLEILVGESNRENAIELAERYNPGWKHKK